jgi:cytochrome P450
VDWLRQRFNTLLRPGAPNAANNLDLVGEARQAGADLRQKLLELIAGRRATCPGNRNHVLGMLVDATDGSGRSLSDEQLLAHVNILLVAGHETTTTLGAWTLFLLAQHPSYLARIEQELNSILGTKPLISNALQKLPMLAAAIREAGRLHSPVMLLPRGVVSDFEFAGRHVEAGTSALLAVGAGHRLASVWDEPARFDPDRLLPPREEDRRTPYAPATFGGGPRICLGINFAQLEVMALVAHVTRHYRVASVSQMPIREHAGILPTYLDALRVQVSALGRRAVPQRRFAPLGLVRRTYTWSVRSVRGRQRFQASDWPNDKRNTTSSGCCEPPIASARRSLLARRRRLRLRTYRVESGDRQAACTHRECG